MELVSCGGETFIMPVETGNKITNVRKWSKHSEFMQPFTVKLILSGQLKSGSMYL